MIARRPRQGSGFIDKLYWRWSAGVYHCFKKTIYAGTGRYAFVSLCGAAEIQRSGGQAIERPEVPLRCGACDGAEMKRRGWSISGPNTVSRA